MNNNIQSYFDAEMRALSEVLHDHHESENLESHHIDRLLEGVAYLTAQIHQRLDDDFPEIPAQLLQQHWPHMIQPYPSGVIMEFSSPTQVIIPKNTVIASQPVGEEKTVCKFSTKSDLEIYPVNLLKIAVDHNQIKFYFESKQPNINIKKLKLFLNTDFYTALDIYYAVGQNNLNINFNNFCSAQLWLDYFGFPEKYLFLELDVYKTDKYFEGVLNFKNKLNNNIMDLDLKSEYFKLNCVPAVNIYTVHGEPIIYKPHKIYYELMPDHSHISSVILHNIQTITAIDNNFKNNYPIDFQRVFQKNKIIIFNKNLDPNAVLSAEIAVSNGHYPAQYIRENMINRPANLYSGITAKNITRPTLSLANPLEKYYLWNCVNQFNLNLDKLDLKNNLCLYNWSTKKSHKKQLDSIISVHKKYTQKIIKNSFCQGFVFEIGIKEEGFKNIAVIYFFGCILFVFLKLKAEVNYFIKLEIKLLATAKVLIWE